MSGRLLSTGLSPYVFSEGTPLYLVVFQLYLFDALEFAVWASRWLVWVILAVCISLNACGCVVQSRAFCGFSLFSVRTLPIFCVPLFVDLFECAFEGIRDSGVLFGTLMYDSDPCRSG